MHLVLQRIKQKGLVVQLVRMPACHAGGREFESRPDRLIIKELRSQILNSFLFSRNLHLKRD